MSTPGSMLSLVSQGLQDRDRLNVLHGNPSLKFYSTVIRKQTRWASRWERVDFDGLADFGRTATATLPIKGELISRITLVVTLPDIRTPQERAAATASALIPGSRIIGPLWSWTNSVGNAIASEITLTIDGQRVDTLDSRLLEILSDPGAEQNGMEHFESTNSMLLRNPMDFSDTEYQRLPANPTVEIALPFWFCKGPGPAVLPIQALAKSKVQITCNFRTIQELVYTDARIDARNPSPSASAAGGLASGGPLPLLSEAVFYMEAPGNAGGVPIYYQNRDQGDLPRSGKIVPGPTGRMPSVSRLHFEDAFFVVEYISLEDREAAAFRTANLRLPFLQHVALPPTPTLGASTVRIPIAHAGGGGGLVRSVTLVAQREEAPGYNAHFLFSRELAPAEAKPTAIPWWPDARIPNWDFGNGYVRPAFVTRRSDPVQALALSTRGLTRFDHEGPSIFRSLIPALGSSIGCGGAPLVNRYVYTYSFANRFSDGTPQREGFHGAANWDLMPRKELLVTMSPATCGTAAGAATKRWVPDTTQTAREWNGDTIASIDSLFSPATEGFYVYLQGATPPGPSGVGAYVRGYVDFQALKALPGYMGTRVRLNANGSAALVVQTGVNQHVWIAVAAGGGRGGGSDRGGDAGDAAHIGFTAGPSPVRSHVAPSADFGGAGGGRLDEAGPGLGISNGFQMLTTDAFVLSHTKTTTGMNGGDGYYGGGEGNLAGGGGGSYVSPYITQVDSAVNPALGSLVRAILTPVVSVTDTTTTETGTDIPKFTLYGWLTTHNILQITGGKGAVLFA